MSELPILFKGPLVRAILDGRKTQTRRLLKPQPTTHDVWGDAQVDELFAAWGESQRRCPYGEPGDLLWVRETHAIVPATAYRHSHDDGAAVPHRVSPDGDSWAVYREGWTRSKPGRWRPSIHMPRWASRLTLRVTEVRVERLQDISSRDLVREGVGPSPVGCVTDPYAGSARQRQEFGELWDGLASEGATWADNPWVWVVAFEREGGEHG